MNIIRGRIDFSIPLPAAVDPASLERLARVITDAHTAIGAFTAAVAGLGGSAAYRPKGERRRIANAAPEPSRPSGTGPAPPITNAETAESFDLGAFKK